MVWLSGGGPEGEEASKVRGQWEEAGPLGGGVEGNQEPAGGGKERGSHGGGVRPGG